jgi:hypothetical protein
MNARIQAMCQFHVGNHVEYISTDAAIPAILYAVAHKVKMGLDVAKTIKVAQRELLGFWDRDMNEIETGVRESKKLDALIKKNKKGDHHG